MRKVFLYANIFLLGIFFHISLVYGDIFHLKQGESIRGHIKSVDEKMIVVESDSGYGIIQIPRSDILMIESPSAELDLSRKFGVGYIHHLSSMSSAHRFWGYCIDQYSLKTFLTEDAFADFVVGFGSIRDEKGALLEVYTLDLRLAMIFDATSNKLLYYGASGGIISVKDRENKVEDTGTSGTVFIGGEFFFVSLPNFGFSGEIGATYQKIGGYEVMDMSVFSFPTVSMHYYF